jgi:fructosamine-3-kinase
MKLRPSYVNMEASFLKKWEEINIKAPHVYEVGYIEDYNYILMEYISSDILTKVHTTEELISKNIFFEMGQVLRKIHTLKTEGFGAWDDNEKAKYKTFKEWIDNDTGINNQVKYTKENNLLPEEIFGSIEEKITLIINYLDKNKISTYCHFDFSPNNILATEPITIFDPVCLINHPYIDLAKSVIQSIANCHDSKCSYQIIDGYFGINKETFDKEVFKACLLFIAHIKFPYWHKKNYKDILDIEKDFLLKNI